jgi:altronate dehydratase
MIKEYMNNLHELSKVMKLNYVKLIGYLMYNQIHFKKATISVTCGDLAIKDIENDGERYLNELKECFSNITNEEFNIILDRLISSIADFNKYYNSRKDILGNEYLERYDFKRIEYMINFELNFVLDEVHRWY